MQNISMSDTELLKFAIEHGMIDTALVQEKIEMHKRKEILDKHPYTIWQGKDGKWRTYIPDENKGRKLVKRNTQQAIEEYVIKYWESNSEEETQKRVAKEISLKNNYDYSLYIITPISGGVAVIGATEKYLSPAAIKRENDGLKVIDNCEIAVFCDDVSVEKSEKNQVVINDKKIKLKTYPDFSAKISAANLTLFDKKQEIVTVKNIDTKIFLSTLLFKKLTLKSLYAIDFSLFVVRNKDKNLYFYNSLDSFFM